MTDYFPSAESCPKHTIFPGVEISTYWLEQIMISIVEMQPHAVVEEHWHHHEQMGIALSGTAVFTIGGETKTVQAGDRFRIPSCVKHKVVALENGFKALDAFSPRREEYM